MQLLDGKLVSASLLENVNENIATYIGNNPYLRKPKMAIVLVGNNPASESYVKSKIKASDRSNIDASLIRFNDDITHEELLAEIVRLNHSDVDGFIVQLPLPQQINTEEIINTIDPLKDIDGFHPQNFGKMALGQKSMRPATAYGILKLIQFYNIETKGKHIVIIGRSNIVGKPTAIMLGNDFKIGRATVTTCDINTPYDLLENETKRADIVIVAVGKPALLTGKMVKEGAIVIDVGINKLDTGKIVGDVDFETVAPRCQWITPVPGGVGPMTIAGLILNTFEAWKTKNLL